MRFGVRIMARAFVTVIGAGVAGLTVALELAERGAGVTVLDKGPAPGPQACSWYAGGMLAPWCEGETAEPLVVRLGSESIDWWDRHVPGVVRRGSLVLTTARDSGELTRFARRTERHSMLEVDSLATLEPDLGGRFPRALYFKDEAHLDPRDALMALVQRLNELGVPIAEHTAVAAPDEIEGDVIDARGFDAQKSLRNLRGVKGEMLVLRTEEVNLSRPVRLIHPRYPVYLVPRGGGIYMVGATQIESEERSRVTARGMVELLNAAYAIHPAFAEAEVVETGCDVRPAFPDNLPRLRRHGRILAINGLFRHGFLLAPAMARMAAETLLNPDFVPEIMDADHRERTSA